jgi:uncharacterized protein (DUF433 family)
MNRKRLGRYIVADPEICHGKPTFAGTRILVTQVLAQIAAGKSWKEIRAEWRNAINQEAIGEAVELARWALVEKTTRHGKESQPV